MIGTMFGSLRAQVLLVVMLALIPTFVLLAISANAERLAGIERARESARSTANLVAEQQSALVASTEHLLTFVTSLMDRPITNTLGCDRGLGRLIAGSDVYNALSILDADGTVRCAAPKGADFKPVNVADRPFFKRAVQTRKFAIGNFAIGHVSGRPVLTFGAPVIDRTGEITSVVYAGLSLTDLNERMSSIGLPEDVEVIVTDHDAHVLVHHPDPQDWIGRPLDNPTLIERIRADREGIAYLPDRDGGHRWHSFGTVGDPDAGTGVLFVDVSHLEQNLFAEVDNRLRQNILSLVMGALVAITLAWGGMSVMITRRAQRLTNVVHKLTAGDWSVRTGLRDNTELGRLAMTFDEMADAIQAHERELRTLNAELEERVVRRSALLERSNARLRASRTELRDLSQQLREVAEQERARLSRDVHDQIGQALTGVKMDIAAARRRLQQSDVEGAEARLVAAVELVDETIRLARRIALDLRPSLLDDFGLTAAVEWQLEDFAQQAGIRYRLATEVDEDAVGPALATAAFRILKEALANVARHAVASALDVRLATDESNLTLVVGDDGRGITEEEQAGSHSLGLLGMRERARQLGGTVTVVGTAGEGTVVTMVLPLETPDTRESEVDLYDEGLDR